MITSTLKFPSVMGSLDPPAAFANSDLTQAHSRPNIRLALSIKRMRVTIAVPTFLGTVLIGLAITHGVRELWGQCCWRSSPKSTSITAAAPNARAAGAAQIYARGARLSRGTRCRWRRDRV